MEVCNFVHLLASTNQIPHQLPSTLFAKDSSNLSRIYGADFIKIQIILYKPLPELYHSVLWHKKQAQEEYLLSSLPH